MKFSCALIVGTILATAVHSFSADLELSRQVSDFLDSAASAVVPTTAALSAPAILTAAPSTARPVVFCVRTAAYSRDRLVTLAAAVNCAATGAVVTQGNVSAMKNGQGTAQVGYDGMRGSYFFFNNAIEQRPLSRTDPLALEALKDRARKLLATVIPDQAQNFVFANTETDWAMTGGGQQPVVVKQTLRFTRRLNGRHIVDNTAYFTASYSGNLELCRFEFVNPHFEPQALEVMVRPSATRDRLTAFAHEKVTAVLPTGEEARVRAITASKALNTYRAVIEGGDTYLVPHISMWSKFQLDNGRSYERFVDLCLDAKRTPNLDSSMIENSGR